MLEVDLLGNRQKAGHEESVRKPPCQTGGGFVKTLLSKIVDDKERSRKLLRRGVKTGQKNSL